MKLTKEEKKIKEMFDKGLLKSTIESKKDLQKYKQYAESTISKNKRVNLRLSEIDLLKIKAIAQKEGLPYQTLIGSIIHKYVENNY